MSPFPKRRCVHCTIAVIQIATFISSTKFPFFLGVDENGSPRLGHDFAFGRARAGPLFFARILASLAVHRGTRRAKILAGKYLRASLFLSAPSSFSLGWGNEENSPLWGRGKTLLLLKNRRGIFRHFPQAATLKFTDIEVGNLGLISRKYDLWKNARSLRLWLSI